MNRNRNLKILFLITDLGKGGAERFLIDLCTELSNYPNIEFIIASLFNINEYREFTSNFRVEYLDFEPFRLRGSNENTKYKKLIEEFKPDIVHSNRFLAEFLTSYNVSKKITYVCHGHDNMIQLQSNGLQTFLSKEKLLYNIEKKWLIRKKYKKAKTYFVVNSEDTKNYFSNNLPDYLKDKIKYIPLGFNFDRFYIHKEKSIDLSKKIKILNVGSFQDKKNQKFLLDIAEELIKRSINFEINMIGDGKKFNLISELITKRGLENYINLHGLIDHVEEWYRSSDLYVHTAYYEPFGLVFLEAMASGTPIVTLDGKGNRDLIENGKTGYIINEQNAKLFADRIESLKNDKILYSEISKYAKIFAKTFDSKARTIELIDFYFKITGKSIKT